jgi:hypothetical protein
MKWHNAGVSAEAEPSSSGEIKRKPTGSIAKPQAPTELKILLDRLQALEERVKALPALNQSTIVASLNERLGALPVPLALPEVQALLSERLAALDMEKLLAKELDRFVARVVEKIQPGLEALVATKVASAPAAAPAKGGDLDAAAVRAIVDPAISAAKAEILTTVDARSQQVATELIQGFGAAEKRMGIKMDDKVKASVADYAGNFEETVSKKVTDALGNFVNSSAFKDTLDKRFRVVVTHLESDVIPRVVKNIIAQQQQQG